MCSNTTHKIHTQSNDRSPVHKKQQVFSISASRNTCSKFRGIWITKIFLRRVMLMFGLENVIFIIKQIIIQFLPLKL